MALGSPLIQSQQEINSLVQDLCIALYAYHIQPLCRNTGSHSASSHPPEVSASHRILVPVAPYGYGLWRPDDDINLVCLSENSQPLFWDFVAENLQLERSKLGSIDDATVVLSSLSGPRDGIIDRCRKLGDRYRIKIFLRYVRMPTGLTPGDFLHRDYPLSLASVHKETSDLRHWNMVQEMQTLSLVLSQPSFESFPSAYDGLRAWAKTHGLYGQRVGLYLNSEMLFWYLFHAYTSNDSVEELDSQLIDAARSVVAKHTKEIESVNRLMSRATNSTTIGIELDGSANIVRLDELKLGDGFDGFLRKHAHYAKIEGVTWATGIAARHTLLDETIASCLQEISKYGQVWPEPVIEDLSSCTYAIGFADEAGTLEQLRACTERRNGSFTAITTMLASAAELSSLHADSLQVRQDQGSSTTPPPTAPAIVSTEHASNKLRTAKDMLSQLRHDPAHTATAYEVGYLDRFEGIMWLPLEEWGSKAVEEEDFIPLTRIRMFRRRDDGAVVWERGKRLNPAPV